MLLLREGQLLAERDGLTGLLSNLSGADLNLATKQDLERFFFEVSQISDGLQPTSDGLHPRSDERRQLNSHYENLSD